MHVVERCRELDCAMLRRLEKRILVGLPTPDARQVMFMHHLPPVICTRDSNGFDLTSDINYQTLAEVLSLLTLLLLLQLLQSLVLLANCLELGG